ncbi:hypothetical protein CHLRE_02g075000v5 [Chlamydomonas reinhardtii]|uniref:Uncharacterized protein n=1 Tax=Chlamydomonas reinhardtii TaxID=3055 RepID=A0A2K3E036_CHLRE|nr:uncharacterized protein CHLRE_02g075000v5 [Chlamydomonas reinhardtii]PNW86150.1 hypothetical protein CHLRE_02g075000v5 [Chlamydomonas reinhardtii]
MQSLLCDWCGAPGGFGTCLYVMCCTPCSYGSLVARLGPEVTCGGSCFGGCCCYTLLSMLGLNCIIHMGVRGHLRNKYGIPGGGCLWRMDAMVGMVGAVSGAQYRSTRVVVAMRSGTA